MSGPLDRAVTQDTCTRGAPVRVVLGNGDELTGELKTYGNQRLSLTTAQGELRSLVVRSLRGVYQHPHQMLVPSGLPSRRIDMQPTRVPVANGVVELYQWVDAEGRESDGAYLSYAYVCGRAEEAGGEVKVLRFEFADSETLNDFRARPGSGADATGPVS